MGINYLYKLLLFCVNFVIVIDALPFTCRVLLTVEENVWIKTKLYYRSFTEPTSIRTYKT